MRIDAAETDGLVFRFHVIHKKVLCKSAIVGMVMLHVDVHRPGVTFECLFGVQCFFAGIGLLQVNEAEATELIDEDGDEVVALLCKSTFDLADEAGDGRFHLID